jgi:two-component system, NarL family, response regulator YdfI
LNSASAPRNSVPAQKRPAIAAIRTLIIAASAERRAALQKLLRGAASIAVVGVLPGTAAAGAYVQHWQPDAVLIDLGLNPGNTERLVAEASGNFSGLTVIVLADHPEAAWTARMLRAGISSILPRDASCPQITAAIQAASEELVVLHPEIVDGMLSESLLDESLLEGEGSDVEGSGSRDIEPLVEELTRREVEVLRMVAAGLGNREIASRLGVSEHTIKFHVSSILGKLGATSRTEAVTNGIRRGLILL